MSEPFAPIAAKARVLEALRASTSADIPSTAEAVKRALRPDADAAEAEADGGTAQPPLIEQEKQTLELAFRFYMEELLAASNKQGKSVGLEGPVSRHLDLSISLAARDMSDYATPFLLLEDLFDATVISEAEVLFNLVEARAAALAPFLTPEPKFQRAKLALIRSCNELLRRLSKSKNTNFRGRVLMFMAYTFPLAERSGVNLKGASAPSSVEIEAEGAGDDADAMQVDAAPAEAAEAAGAAGAVNYGFYATFWGLQQAFADPGKQVIQTVWPGLVERLQTVLEVFGSFSGSDDVTDEGGVAEPDAAEGTSGGGGGGEAKPPRVTSEDADGQRLPPLATCAGAHRGQWRAALGLPAAAARTHVGEAAAAHRLLEVRLAGGEQRGLRHVARMQRRVRRVHVMASRQRT